MADRGNDKGTYLENAWLIHTSAEHTVRKWRGGGVKAHPGNDEVGHHSEMAVADTGNSKGGLIW